MKTQLLVSLLAGSSLLLTAAPSLAQSENDSSQATNSMSLSQQMFACDMSQENVSTVITGSVTPENPEPIALINWSRDYFSSDQEISWLCQNVSEQLQTLYEEGKLTDLSMVSQGIGGDTAICLEYSADSGCDELLFTVDTEKEPKVVLYELLAADFKPFRTRGDFPTSTRLNFRRFFSF